MCPPPDPRAEVVTKGRPLRRKCADQSQRRAVGRRMLPAAWASTLSLPSQGQTQAPYLEEEARLPSTPAPQERTRSPHHTLYMQMARRSHL